MKQPVGRHFLQIPGPTNVPESVLRAISYPTVDHRGPEFQDLAMGALHGLKSIFKTNGHVIVYPSSGTGAWEASLVNTLSPGDKILMFETGHFSDLWRNVAVALGLQVDYVPGDWRSGADPNVAEDWLGKDSEHAYKAVAVVHNETSTGVTSDIEAIRSAMDSRQHPALLLVDTISSLGSIDYRHDEWGVDVTIAGSQKGLMLPPGLGLNAISDRAKSATSTAKLPRAYWDWHPMLESNKNGFFPYTPSTNLLYGLKESLRLLEEEGLENVFHRHERHAKATRTAVEAWGLETVCSNPAEYSNSLTAVFMPDDHNADAFLTLVLERYNTSLGTGLGRLAGRVFRIGHLGSFNDAMLLGTLGVVEAGLIAANVPFKPTGVQAATGYLNESHDPN